LEHIAIAFAYWLIATALYAVFLQRIYTLYNPDYVIFTVAGGIILTWLGVRYLAVNLPFTSWQEYERWMIYGFSTTGIVMAIWQGWQVVWRRNNARENGGR
jgi:small neutral amino acid transporter SnatA (MarC family)